jgi:hypothetical protein
VEFKVSYDLAKTLEDRKKTPQQKREEKLKKCGITPPPKFKGGDEVFQAKIAIRKFKNS